MTNPFHTIAAIAVSAIVFLDASCSKVPVLLSPWGNAILTTNTPTLAWSKTDCDRFEIWIDDVKLDEVEAKCNFCVPFPLSFGEHVWYVKAFRNNKASVSRPGSFTITGGTLNRLPESAQLLRNDWFVASSVTVGNSGESLSSASVPHEGWAKTSIPATVLTALVRNGVYPNPYVGMNNMLIPDSDDSYNQDYNLLKYSHLAGRNPWKDPYWYVTEFSYGGKPDGRVILTFEEINYRAEVWLNGNKIATADTMVGMERSYSFDVTDCLRYGADNHMAVAIYPVDIPGKPAPDPLTALADPGCNMGDGKIGRNYTKWDTMGWDWQPPVRDRDMGITEEVYLHIQKGIVIDNIYVASDIDSMPEGKASVTVRADMKNNEQETVRGELTVNITGNGEDRGFTIPFRLGPGEEQTFTWTREEYEELVIEHPKLWWPVGYGEQPLYGLTVSARTDKGTTISKKEIFGIRKIRTYVGDDERIIEINGRKIYPRGGNWVIDMMLNWNASRFEKEILLTRNAGLNMLRVWGPTGIAPEAFFDAADKYGILLWQDFLNDFWGTFKNTPGYQPEEELFCDITSGIVRKYRNHPSLVMWCGGNEGANPREKAIVEKILPVWDDLDSRFYLKASDGDGLHGGGPYNTLQPQEYFTHPKLHGFSSEIGPSGVPVMESVGKTLRGERTESAPDRFPLDGFWAFHDANDWPGSDSRKFTTYDNMLRNWYGAPVGPDPQASLSDYLDKAQLVNYDVYRASIESVNRRLWDRGSGILLWKANSSWPSFTWQVYDWFLQSHSGYFGTKNATSSIHAQWNRDDNSVSVINLDAVPLEDVSLTLDYYSSAGLKTRSETEVLSVASDCVVVARTGVAVGDQAEFLRISITDKAGNILSASTYSLGGGNDFHAFAGMPCPRLRISVTPEEQEREMAWRISVKNASPSIAFFTEFRIAGKESGCEQLPSFWSDNFITLMPGEEKALCVSVFKEDILEPPVLEYRSYGRDRNWKTLRLQ